MSKRKLRTLVEEGIVSGWDDPRLPTLQGLRRRGYTPKSIRNFCDRIGVSKVDSVVSYDFLEFCLREDLNENALRAMAVLDPVKLIITNYPEDKTETLEVENYPNKPELGTHEITFSRELWIERSDFMEDPPRKYFRMFPGNEVRLRGGYIVRCTGCEKDEDGNITAVLAEYDPETRGGSAPDGRKIRGTIHWVDSKTGLDAEIRLYDKLFSVEDPDGDERDYHELINPDSLKVLEHAKLEKWLGEAEESPIGYQFMRQGYFVRDKDYTPERPVYNRSVSLRDTYNRKKK